MIVISTFEEADEVLSTYTPEEILQLWQAGAFQTPFGTEVLDYFVSRITSPDKKH